MTRDVSYESRMRRDEIRMTRDVSYESRMTGFRMKG
jgi:hypothetical protein